ncbi:peptidase domain-containing ABC transporter [Bordetella genomosp. 11]|uniref:peptidase domain-containing ABC transporter n=1 Tax=Bordetella genomosp. 11 TaxID=1416808 RepID=UPI001C3DF891|nr:peptidase domain-containing ABC transporter [Bordetella genomosp. 11]
MTRQTSNATPVLFSFRGHRSITTVLQVEAAECGLACLSMIAGYYGHRVGLSELRRRNAISQKGGNFAGLVQIANQLRLASRAVRLELDSLGSLKTPCILHWEFNHFVVLERVKSGVAYIHDPAHGFRKVSMAEVSRKFTGVALETWPAEGFEKINETTVIRLSRLIGSLKGLRGTFLQLLALSASLEIFVLAAPFYVQWTVDHAIPSADFDLMALLAVGFVVLVICQHATALVRSWLLMHLGAAWNVRWRANIFSHLIHLPLEFFIKRHLGDLLSKFGAADEIQRTVTTSFLEGTIDGLMTFLTLALLFLYSPTLACIAFLAAVIYAVIRASWFGPLRAAVQTHLIHAAKQQSHFLETLRGIRAIKLFSREADRRAAWLSLLADQINADVRVQRLSLVYKHSNGLLSGLENILVVWLGAHFVIDGTLTVGALMAFIAYKTLFQNRMSALIDKIAEYRMLSVQADRLSDIALAQAEEPEDSPLSCDSVATDVDAVEVEVSHLSFRYGDFEPLVLDDVSFTIYPGESVAITGASGSGKSTLAHMLLGILAPTSGSIVLRTSAILHRDVRALRRAFGTVMQDDMLLAGSLFENISFFDAGADPAWVTACAKMACIHDDIEAMPMRYDTLVGDMGSVLSGGQKQRILLARALYKKPACLLLDEATSHLDIACERQVNAAVRALRMTRIIIAHRPETIASADRVLYLERGRIVTER